MSILIKGIEIPECCDKCWALNDYSDYPVCLITGETRGYNFRIRERRMDKCPLVEVPTPHGRLIDADKLFKWIKAECNPYGAPTIRYEDGLKVLDIIDRCSTIIEAEEGQE